MNKNDWLNSLLILKSNVPISNKDKFYRYFFKYIVLVPSEKMSKYNLNFEMLGLKSPHDFKLFIKNLKSKLNVGTENYIWRSDLLVEDVIVLFEKAKMNNNNFIYHKKGVPQLISLYLKIRNGLSHGNYYIKGQKIVIWNKSVIKNNLNALMILHLKDFYLIFDLLYKYKHKKL